MIFPRLSHFFKLFNIQHHSPNHYLIILSRNHIKKKTRKALACALLILNSISIDNQVQVSLLLSRQISNIYATCSFAYPTTKLTKVSHIFHLSPQQQQTKLTTVSLFTHIVCLSALFISTIVHLFRIE